MGLRNTWKTFAFKALRVYLAAVILGIGISSLGIAQLTTHDNFAAWQAAAGYDPNDFNTVSYPVDFNEFTSELVLTSPGSKENVTYQDFDIEFPNVGFGGEFDDDHTPIHTDGSPALQGILAGTPGLAELRFVFPNPVPGFHFTIQEWIIPGVPILSLETDPNAGTPITITPGPDGFYGAADPNNLISSFTLKRSPLSPPFPDFQAFVIDDLFFFDPNFFFPEPEFTLTFTGSVSDDYSNIDNWQETFSGLPAAFSPDSSIDVTFNSVAGSNTTVDLESGGAAASVGVYSQEFLFTTFSTPPAELLVGGGVDISANGQLTCDSACIISSSYSDVSANGTLSIEGGEFNTGSLDVNSGSVDVDAGSLDASSLIIDAGTTKAVNGGTINISNQLTLDNGGTLDVAGGGLDTPGSARIGDSNIAASGNVEIGPTGTLRGKGTIVGHLLNLGRLTPGFSPEVINVDGDYTQDAAGFLEIEVGGHDPNVPEFDQVLVTGTATLGGRLDMPLIDVGGGVFDPDPNDEVVFLTAGTVVSFFDTLSSPNLTTVNSNLAMEVVKSSWQVKIRFVTPDNSNQFGGTNPSSNWADPNNWTSGIVPDSSNVVTVDNVGLVDQRVEILADPNIPDSDNAFVHSLVIEGTTNTMTLAVLTGSNLSAVAGLDVADNGVLELGGGTVVTNELEVQGGGQLTGDGTIVAGNGTSVGTVIVGDGSGMVATLSPGVATVGNIDIEGNYQQQSNGTALLDIDDPNTFDTVAITNTATLAGTLEVVLSDPNDAPVGTVFEVITAGGITGTFDDVITTGTDDIVLVPSYGTSPLVAATEWEALTTGESVFLTSFAEGDMDPFTPGLGEEDAVAFALALTDPETYRNTYGISADEMGDIDDMNGLDFDDIDDFVKILNEATGGSMTMTQMFQIIEEVRAVPEPNTSVLAISILIPSMRVRRRIHHLQTWN